MKRIQINYDLIAPGRNYQPVYDYIKSFKGWCHPLESMWIVSTNKTAPQVRDELVRLVDRNDKIVTFDVTGAMWATSFSDAHSEWLKKHVLPLAA